MTSSYQHDVAAVQRIDAIPAILQMVQDITGMRFACIARVTADSWTACAVLDKIAFGMLPGDCLDVSTTLCSKVRADRQAVIIDAARTDAQYRDHPTPVMYDFESYISVPIFRQDGDYFGTLCGLDPLPKAISNSPALGAMTLFAQLISHQLDVQQELDATHSALLDVQATAELREQFIAVLGHDLRNPLGTIITGADLLLLGLQDERQRMLAQLIQRSGRRMAEMVDDVVDLTRGKMGGGIALRMQDETDLTEVFEQVVAELRSTYPLRDIRLSAGEHAMVRCDAGRIDQLCSNLLKNALIYGDERMPVSVSATMLADAFELSVSNHGPAIPAATITQLFQPYWRAASNTPHAGLGLGLFIVAEIARSHAGRMHVASTDELTTFTFSLQTS